LKLRTLFRAVREATRLAFGCHRSGHGAQVTDRERRRGGRRDNRGCANQQPLRLGRAAAHAGEELGRLERRLLKAAALVVLAMVLITVLRGVSL
jgi:hypothetical protein